LFFQTEREREREREREMSDDENVDQAQKYIGIKFTGSSSNVLRDIELNADLEKKAKKREEVRREAQDKEEQQLAYTVLQSIFKNVGVQGLRSLLSDEKPVEKKKSSPPKKSERSGLEFSIYKELDQTHRYFNCLNGKNTIMNVRDKLLLVKKSVMVEDFGEYEFVVRSLVFCSLGSRYSNTHKQVVSKEKVEKYDKKNIMECLKVLDIAHTLFIESGILHNWKHELEYLLLYEKVLEFEDLFFDGLLSIDSSMTFNSNFYIAERITCVLGTLALIYRQRGNLKKADLITRTVYTRAIDTHLKMGKAINDSEIIRGNEHMRYNYNTVRMNLAFQLHREDEYVPICREIVRHEIERNYSYQKCNYLDFIAYRGIKRWKQLLSKTAKKKLNRELNAYKKSLPIHFWPNSLPKVSLKIFARMPDECILYVVSLSLFFFLFFVRNVHTHTYIHVHRYALLMPMYSYQYDEPNPKFDNLRKCEACGKTERAMKEFKVCGGCKSVSYCSAECQKDSWNGVGRCEGKKSHCKKCKSLRGSRSRKDAERLEAYEKNALLIRKKMYVWR
jgi:hypothetical protein